MTSGKAPHRKTPDAALPVRLPEPVTTAFPIVGIGASAGGLNKIFVLLRTQTGHDFSQYKPSTIYHRIERRMAVHQIETLDDYIKQLQQTPAEVEALFRDLPIGVTRFFCDTEPFRELETSMEELQSINEELATVNTELQTMVLDLSRANNDMNNLLAGTDNVRTREALRNANDPLRLARNGSVIDVSLTATALIDTSGHQSAIATTERASGLPPLQLAGTPHG